jgi:hypothetical protein
MKGEDSTDGMGEDSGSRDQKELSPEDAFQVERYEDAEDAGALFLECITIALELDWTQPTHEGTLGGQTGLFVTSVNGVQCVIKLMTTDPFIENRIEISYPTKFLWMAANTWENHHELLVLVVYDLGPNCVRATSLSLLVPRDGLEQVLQRMELKRELIVLA